MIKTIKMKNWKSEFQINYHVNFLMEDATMITKHEGIVIEAENEKQVQDLVQSYFKTNPESFVESPEDMISKVARQELIIDKVKKVWKHLCLVKQNFIEGEYQHLLHFYSYCLLVTQLYFLMYLELQIVVT